MLISVHDRSGVGMLPWVIFLGPDFKLAKCITAVDDETGYYTWEEPTTFGFGRNARIRYVERYAISPRIRIKPDSLTIFIL